MAGINKVTILGSLGRDPELSYTNSNMAVCKLAIATSEKGKDGTEKTEWHKVTAWGKQAEVIAQHFQKGQTIYIEGKIVYGQYEKEGQKHYTTDIFVREFAFCGGGGQRQEQPKPEPARQVEKAFGADTKKTRVYTQDDQIPF